jgi:hypothetical protein
MTFFHYCPTAAFFSIIKNREVWLSSLTASNDSMEGKWVSNIIGIAAIKWGIPPADGGRIIDMVRMIEQSQDCLGFCLSEAEDTLSQWRGYADDGAGFSIGFSEEFMDSFRDPNDPLISAHRVIYTLDEQLKLFEPMAQSVRRAIEEGAFASQIDSLLVTLSEENRVAVQEGYQKAHSDLSTALTSEFSLFFKLKNSAFDEEKEWRLIRMALDPYTDLEYRVRGSRLVPYLSENFRQLKRPISKVLIGPKNPTSKDVVFGFLAKHGFDNVPVEISRASYR